jgi:DnaJ homolog subfamily C member 28
MDRWESLIDKKIREAMEAGEFDNLAGTGQPIDLSENPYEDPDWRTAHRLLRNAGFAPSWIEERKDIDAELEAARIVLARAWLVLRNARDTRDEPPARSRWEKAEAQFRLTIVELNRRIDAWNLKTPALAFHRNRIDVEREIDRIKS